MLKNIFSNLYNSIISIIKLILFGLCALLPFILCVIMGVLQTNLIWFILSVILEVIGLVVYIIKR